MILAVLIIYLAAGGAIEVRLDPPKTAGTVEECRTQLDEMHRKMNLPLIVAHLGPIERIIGECRVNGEPA